ncbi:serine/threonine protein kinase, partial [Planctomycetota bacterium]
LQEVLHDLAIGKDKAVQRFTLIELMNVFLRVCDGVAFAHSKGVTHRDIKPANIMVGEYGEVLVMDWGLAKIKGEKDVKAEEVVQTLRGDSNLAQTLDGSVAGTPSYMPPEQARGDIDEIDHQSDVYSLGAVLYEMLALWPPYRGKSVTDVITKVIQGELAPPDESAPDRDIPKEIAAVCMKAMAHDKEDRYANVADLSADIRLYLEGRAVSAKEDTFTARPSR